MTKTHAQLLPCPHCGVDAELYEHNVPDCFVVCSKTCIKPQHTKQYVVAAWNKRNNKEAQFLEELLEFATYHAVLNRDLTGYCQGVGDAYRVVIEKIKQFEAEQKQDTTNET